MITRRVNRYWCEHCKRAGQQARHIAAHEIGCTKNPARVCRMHEMMTGEKVQEVPLAVLKCLILALAPDWKAVIAALREEARGCPACIFAAIRQTNFKPWLEEDCDGVGEPRGEPFFPPELHFDGHLLGFDFKAELASAWADYNSSREPEDCHG
jgi:hypothetical protein